MNNGYVFYNPLAGSGNTLAEMKQLEKMLDVKLEYYDVTKITAYKDLFEQLQSDDIVVVAGGDGTLNRFVNATKDLDISQKILYYPSGSGNDFAREMGKKFGDKPFDITRYLQNLPVVRVKGKEFSFINGVGYGIDGYCCRVGDELRATSCKKVDYTAIAIKGLLFCYRPTGAKVTVDGKTEHFKKVWLAPTMYGRYYGGGMIPAPAQDRNSECREISAMVFHGTGKLRTLMIFPSLFKGEHIKHTKYVRVLAGKEITVEFDEPRDLQIDGETISGVTSYTATACPVKAVVNC